jgi:hypothetical protein
VTGSAQRKLEDRIAESPPKAEARVRIPSRASLGHDAAQGLQWVSRFALCVDCRVKRARLPIFPMLQALHFEETMPPTTPVPIAFWPPEPDRQRRHAQNEGHRSHHDRPQPLLGGDRRGLRQILTSLKFTFANSTIRRASAPKVGNPLWAIPLDNLRETRERPQFSASRRPPAPPVVAAAPVEAPPPPPPPSEPEKPPLALVGVVHGAADNIGIFIKSGGPVRDPPRVGRDDHGWVVRAADIRAVTLQKDSQQVKLELAARDSTAPPGSEVASMAPPSAVPSAWPIA